MATTYTRPVVNQGVINSIRSQIGFGGVPSVNAMAGVGPQLIKKQKVAVDSFTPLKASRSSFRPGPAPIAEHQQLQRNALRSMGAFPAAELAKRTLNILNLTEGNRVDAYPDPIGRGVDGIAIGMGLNLSVQDATSLPKFVGNDPELIAKFTPFLGKKWSDLTPKDKETLKLTQAQNSTLNTAMAQTSLASTARYAGDMTAWGQSVLANLQHWTGDTGLKTAKSTKLGITRNGVQYNPIAKVILNGAATDAGLLEALKEIQKHHPNKTVRDRLEKLIKGYEG